MLKVKSITKEDFLKKYKISLVDPFSTGVFSPADLQAIQRDIGIVGIGKKIGTIPELIIILYKEPVRILTHILPIVKGHFSGIFKYYRNKLRNPRNVYPFSDYALKASIISSYNPRRLLEIGTARGWGITTFASVLDNCECFTMSPKNTYGANNELPTKQIGSAFKNKKLGIRQIWNDSLTFDYKSFKKVDVSYIDGNHAYKWVYSDLVNCNKITKKLILLDDYIPSSDSDRGEVVNWGWWNGDVVKAVRDYLRKYPSSVKEAYWIIGTPIGVLIK